jgi:FHA domain
MIKCPFCHFENEDGALFCEQCKSDLSGVASTLEPAIATAEPVMAEALPVFAEPLLLEPEPVLAEAVPLEAEPVPAEPLPALEAIPMELSSPPPPPPVAIAPPPPAPAAAPVAPAPAAQPALAPLAPGSQPRLVVLRGQKRNVEYPIYEGLNFIGRADDKPVDIDLEDQEPPDRVWCSRQHACISFEEDTLAIEDLNSANGTYVNRARIYPGQRRNLSPNDIIQIGNVQLKVVV